MRVGEVLRAERAEAAAEEMALSLTKAEYAAREAASSAEQLREELEQSQMEIAALRAALAAAETDHASALAALKQEVAAERLDFASSHQTALAERTKLEEALRNAARAHEKELATAVEDREYMAAELEERQEEQKYLLRAMGSLAKHEQRQVRRALEPWCHLGWRLGAFKMVVRHRKLKGLKAGLAALRTIGVLDELRGTEMRATGAMRHRFRRRALHTWLDFAGSRRTFLRRLNAGVTGFRLNALVRAHHAWCATANAKRMRVKQMHSAASEWRGAGMRKAYSTWLELFALHQTKRRAAVAFLKRKVRSSYNTWAAIALVLGESRRKLRLALKALDPVARKMRAALNSFRGALADAERLRLAGRRVLHSHMLKGLNSWAELHRSRLSQLAALRRGAASLRNAGLARAFRRLTEAMREGKEKLRQLRVAAETLRGTGLRKAWNSLTETLTAGRTKRTALVIMRTRKLRMAYNTFAEIARALANSSRKISGVLKSIDPVTRNLRLAYNSMRQAAQIFAHLRFVASSFFFYHKRLGFNTWKAGHADETRGLRALRMGAQTMRQGGLTRACRSWRACASAQAETNRRLKASVDAFKGAGQRKAWNSWAELHSRRRTMRKALVTMRMRKVRAAANSWHEQASGSRARKRRLKAFHPETRLKRAAFNSIMQRFLMLRALRRTGAKIRMIRERRALQSWRQGANDGARRMRALRFGASSFRSRSLRMCATTWMAHAFEGKRHLRNMGVAAAQRRGVGLRSVFIALVDGFVRFNTQVGAIRSMRQRKARLGLKSWRGVCIGTHEWRRSAQAAWTIFDLQRRLQRAAFTSWSRGHASLMELRRCFHAAILAQLARAYRGWREGAAIFKEENERTPWAIKRAMGAFRHSRLSIGFRTWAEEVAAKLSHLRRARSAVREWAHGGGLRKGWYTWLELAAELGSLRRKLFSLANRGLTKAFKTWLELAEERSALKAIAQGAAKDLMMGGNYRGAWKAWLAAAAAARNAKRAGLAMLNARLVTATNTWREATYSRRTVAMRMLNITREAERRALVEAFAKLRHRELITQWQVMTSELWLRPSFDRWIATWFLVRMGRPHVLGARHLFRRWVENWQHAVRRAHANFLVGRERLRACHKGRTVLRSMRHGGMSGVLGVWRHAMLSGRPALSQAWILWRGHATRMPAAKAFRRRTVRRLLARGLVAFELARDARRLEDRLEALHAGRRAKLKVWQTEIMSAERHAALLRKALEKAKEKSASELAAVEKERDAALRQARSMQLQAEAERRAALQALANQTPVHSPPKQRVSADRWSTAAARGHAHANVSADKLEQIFRSQRETAEDNLLRAKAKMTPARSASKAALATVLFTNAGSFRREREAQQQQQASMAATAPSDAAAMVPASEPTDAASATFGTPAETPVAPAARSLPPAPSVLGSHPATVPKYHAGGAPPVRFGRASSPATRVVLSDTPTQRPAWGSASSAMRRMGAVIVEPPQRRGASPARPASAPSAMAPSPSAGAPSPVADLIHTLD